MGCWESIIQGLIHAKYMLCHGAVTWPITVLSFSSAFYALFMFIVYIASPFDFSAEVYPEVLNINTTIYLYIG